MADLARRFYETVSVAAAANDPNAFAIELDGKPVKTPGRITLAIPHRRLADAVADEWRSQQGKLDLTSMPLTRLAMAAQDHVEPRLDAVRSEALAYAQTDLLCYRASEPAKLVKVQHELWQPYLDWLSGAFGARLNPTQSVVAVEQDKAALGALSRAVREIDPYRLLALHSLTARFGSIVLALAVIHHRASAQEALTVSRLDEFFQTQTWGADEEAERRNAAIAKEVEDLSRLLALLD